MKVLLLLGSCVFVVGAFAQNRRPASSAKVGAQLNSRVSLGWLPDKGKTQNEALERLAGKAGVSSAFCVPASAPVRAPSLSARELSEWLAERERGTAKEGRSGWTNAGAQLLLARELGDSKQAQWRMWGAGLARRTALWVAARDGDTALGAQILGGFALPFVNDLPDKIGVQGADESDLLEPNKQLLLQDATDFYRTSGNPDRLLSAVSALVYVARKAGDVEGADWARIKLAQDLGNRGLFYEAIGQLKAVSSPTLLGARAWIPDLEQKAKAQNLPAPAAQPDTAEAEAEAPAP